MRKYLILSLFLVVCSLSKADNYEYLVFATSSGEIALKADGLKITFSNGNLVATNAEESQTMPLSTLSKFCFSHDTTGIEDVINNLEPGFVDIYTTAGLYLGRFVYTTGETLPLPKGMYIVKGERSTKKLIVK